MERTASVYQASGHVGLKFCPKRLKEHSRMLIAMSLSQNSDLFEVGELS